MFGLKIKFLNNYSFNNSTGFTLVELLIVISIIGILAGVVIGVIDPQRQRAIASDAVTQSTMNKFVEGIEAYNSANAEYPSEAAIASGTVSFINLEAKPASLSYNLSGDGQTFYLCNVTAESEDLYFVYDSTIAQIFKCGPGQEVTNCTPYECN